MYILGISAFYHDSAAALLKDGEIIAAAQEERFTRKKGDASLPIHSINFCLKKAGIQINDLDEIIYYENPNKKFQRLLSTYLALAPRGLSSFLDSMPVWLTNKLWIKNHLRKELGYKKDVLNCDHHLSHAASAFYPSPYESAAILTMDGVGEWSTTTLGLGRANKIELLKEIRFPHSLGMLYSAFTYYAGFKVNSGEYKVMGLAPYGEPKYVQKIYDELIDLKEDGSFRMNMKYFDFCVGRQMTSPGFDLLFDGPPRKAESQLTQKEMDIARSIQVVTEEIVLRLAKELKRLTKEPNVCLSGGVALNCVANGKLAKSGIFDRIWIQPAAGDAGSALGAALHAWYGVHGQTRQANNQTDLQKGSYLGPSYGSEEIREFLQKVGAPYKEIEKQAMPAVVGQLVAESKVIGLLQGPLEFGPRALGNRSILGDPRSPKMQSLMNLKIKFRESFRPFAPSVLKEKADQFFEIDPKQDSPYMLLVADVQNQHRNTLSEAESKLWGIEKLNVPRSIVPAITHVDFSARLQTVTAATNPFYYNLIKEFDRITGVGMVINTSFNVRGEPIVCTYEDAYRCFMRTNIDYLVLENFILEKSEQPAMGSDTNWQNEFVLD